MSRTTRVHASENSRNEWNPLEWNTENGARVCSVQMKSRADAPMLLFHFHLLTGHCIWTLHDADQFDRIGSQRDGRIQSYDLNKTPDLERHTFDLVGNLRGEPSSQPRNRYHRRVALSIVLTVGSAPHATCCRSRRDQSVSRAPRARPPRQRSGWRRPSPRRRPS